MAVSMIGPKFYAWDRCGRPLAFGRVYTYAARTNKPKATYQSEDAEVENTNPVVLNGEGYANIYLDGSYKIVVKDKYESEVWTADPVSSGSNNDKIIDKFFDTNANAISEINGDKLFIRDAFKVTGTDSTYSVAAGSAYIQGYGVTLKSDRVLQVSVKPSFVYLDIFVNSEKNTEFSLSASNLEIADYMDSENRRHYVSKVAKIVDNKSVEDLRENTFPFSAYRPINKKLNDVISPEDFGARSDVEIDNTGSLNLALIASEGKTLDLANKDYYFSGPIVIRSNTIIKNGTLRVKNSHANTVHVASAKNVEFKNVKFEGESLGIIKISDGSENIRIVNCSFSEKLNQNIWLWACEDILVDGCSFNKCGYGVIAQRGYASNNVRIVNCHSHKQKNDFVEANSANVLCRNWIIANNTFEGQENWHESGTESRFVGVTALQNLVIANNVVKNVKGDSAVHLEAGGGSVVINGNVFENCNGNSWIYLLHSAKNTIISGNYFLRSDTRSNNFVISTVSNDYSNTVLINGNSFLDSTDERKMVPVYNGFQRAPMVFSNNTIENCRAAVYLISSNQMTINANVTKNCMYGVVSNATVNNDGTTTRAGGHAGASIIITDNSFHCEFGSIYSTTNTSGTNGPRRWLIQNNIVSSDIKLLNWSSSPGQAEFNVCENNLLWNNATIDVAGKIEKDASGNFVGYTQAS